MRFVATSAILPAEKSATVIYAETSPFQWHEHYLLDRVRALTYPLDGVKVWLWEAHRELFGVLLGTPSRDRMGDHLR
jgi:hypothetical protein